MTPRAFLHLTDPASGRDVYVDADLVDVVYPHEDRTLIVVHAYDMQVECTETPNEVMERMHLAAQKIGEL